MSAGDNSVNQVAATQHDGGTDQQRHQQDWHDRLLLFVRAGQSTFSRANGCCINFSQWPHCHGNQNELTDNVGAIPSMSFDTLHGDVDHTGNITGSVLAYAG